MLLRPMPYRPMSLRGTRVFARCAPDGTLVAEGGRVEIRYKPTDIKSYAAALGNLEPVRDGEVLPDDAFAAASPAPAKGSAAAKPAKKAGAARTDLPTKPEPGGVLAYADGACSGNPGPAGLGVVLLTETDRHELSEYLGEGTNNIAELTAIKRAADAVRDPSAPVRIMTDSSYAIGVLSKGWKAKANQALVADVKRALARLERWELGYVPGHAGVPLNERADALAVAAVRERAPGAWKKVSP